MKKVLMIFAMLCGVLSAYAGKTFIIQQGNLTPLKEAGNVIVSFDFEGATFDNSQPLASKYDNLSDLVAKVPSNFMQGFMEKAKKSHIVADASDATYSIEIKVENMDFFYSAMSFIPGYITKLWGTITFKNIATGEIVCIVRIEEGTGDRDFSIDDSFGKTFIELGENVAKMVNKGKI